MNRLKIASLAMRQIQGTMRWYRRQSSSETVARKWEAACYLALAAVREHPERAMLLPECDVMEDQLHQIAFGSGRRKTHRAILRFEGETVHVLSIRHLMQRDIEPEDLLD